MNTRSRALLIILALMAGCKSTSTETGQVGETPAAATTYTSGFLLDYSRLQPDPTREGTMVYIDKTVDIRPYTKLYFDPVTVIVAPSADNTEVPPDVILRMSDRLLESFQKALYPRYQVVSAPGPDVLRVKTAITGIQAATPSRGVTDFIPIKAAFNLAREATGTAPRVAEMKAELVLLDPKGRLVGEGTVNRKGDKNLSQGDQVTWQDLTAITEYCGKGFRNRLDQLRGEAP